MCSQPSREAFWSPPRRKFKRHGARSVVGVFGDRLLGSPEKSGAVFAAPISSHLYPPHAALGASEDLLNRLQQSPSPQAHLEVTVANGSRHGQCHRLLFHIREPDIQFLVFPQSALLSHVPWPSRQTPCRALAVAGFPASSPGKITFACRSKIQIQRTCTCTCASLYDCTSVVCSYLSMHTYMHTYIYLHIYTPMIHLRLSSICKPHGNHCK